MLVDGKNAMWVEVEGEESRQVKGRTLLSGLPKRTHN